MRAPGYTKAARFAAWLLSAIVLVCFWQGYTKKFDVSPAIFPSPLEVWQSLRANLADGTFVKDLVVTLREVMIGFFGGSLLGFFLALVISEFRPVRTIVYPYVIAFNYPQAEHREGTRVGCQLGARRPSKGPYCQEADHECGQGNRRVWLV